MKIPLNVTFRHQKSSPALRDLIEARADALDHEYPRLIRCDVAVSGKGGDFETRVYVTIPGATLAARATGDDAYRTVRRAFDHIRREVLSFEARRRERRVSAPSNASVIG